MKDYRQNMNIYIHITLNENDRQTKTSHKSNIQFTTRAFHTRTKCLNLCYNSYHFSSSMIAELVAKVGGNWNKKVWKHLHPSLPSAETSPFDSCLRLLPA